MSEKKAEPSILTEFHEKTSVHEIPDWIKVHLDRYAADPHEGHLWDGREFGGYEKTPTLLLTTRGRKSGRMLTMPLIYGKDGDRFVIIGSKGGAPQNPAWVLNLEADPNAEVQVIEDKFHAKASIASGAERQRLWAMMEKIYPPFPSYQARTQREIPVVILTRS